MSTKMHYYLKRINSEISILIIDSIEEVLCYCEQTCAILSHISLWKAPNWVGVPTVNKVAVKTESSTFVMVMNRDNIDYDVVVDMSV